MMNFISKDMQKYMAENNLEFSDFEKAALIYNSALSVKEKHVALKRLAKETSDEALKQQIADRLNDDRRDMEAFMNNAEGYVYVVLKLNDRDKYFGNEYGHFSDWQTACANGMALGCEFGIKKFRIISSENYPSRKINPSPDLYHLTHQEYEVFAWEDDLYPQAGFYFRSDGTLYHFWSSEIKREDKAVPDAWAKGRFENSPVRMPNPFEKGDIVRFMKTGKCGIVEMSKEEWSSVERAKTGDFTDSELHVFLFDNDGGADHCCLSPILLEKYEPQKDDENYELLMLGRDAYTGSIPVERFLSAVDDHKKRRGK